MAIEAGQATTAAQLLGAAGAELQRTGMKFDRTLQDTPESVKVFTAEEIDRQNLVNVYDLIDRTANLSSSFAESGFNIRGISNNNVSGYGFGDLATIIARALPRQSKLGSAVLRMIAPASALRPCKVDCGPRRISTCSRSHRSSGPPPAASPGSGDPSR